MNNIFSTREIITENDLRRKWMEEEYVVQLFKFRVADVVSGVANAFYSFTEEGLDSACKRMNEIHEKSSGEHKIPEEEKAKDAILARYREVGNNRIQNLESYFEKSLFHIPEDSLLPEDGPQVLQFTPEEYKKMKSDVMETREALLRARAKRVLLQQELEKAKALEECQSACKKFKKNLMDAFPADMDIDELEDQQHKLSADTQYILQKTEQMYKNSCMKDSLSSFAQKFV